MLAAIKKGASLSAALILITRDSVAVEWSFKGRAIELLDTAGLRRRSRVHESLEKLSSDDTFASLGRAAVVVLLFDATEPLAKQDLGIGNRLAEEGRAPVIVLNKWDLVGSPQGVMQDMIARLEDSLPQLRGAARRWLPVQHLRGRAATNSCRPY